MSAKATASGADTGNGAKSREHNQGNQDKKYTIEQKAAVIRVRRCTPTAFYEILDLESVKTTVTESEIKKAYRKLSLLTHPDKNGHEHADEAFKMVSRAFGVLGDKEKRDKYDRFGGDPDSRSGGGGAPQSSPFSGFGGRAASGGGPGGARGGWDEEISPEEMFNRFFGGGMGGFGGFDTGPQFVFNMGGGPGIRVHQFGGGRPRRRPQEAGAEGPEQSIRATIASLLPILILFIIPLLSSLFSGGESVPSGPQVRFNKPEAPFTLLRSSKNYNVDYYVDPAEIADYTTKKFAQLDQKAELIYIKALRVECEREDEKRQRVLNEAQGWLFQDPEKIKQARGMEMKACRKLEKMNQIPRGSF